MTVPVEMSQAEIIEGINSGTLVRLGDLARTFHLSRQELYRARNTGRLKTVALGNSASSTADAVYAQPEWVDEYLATKRSYTRHDAG
jgi:hypothetical protein